MTRPIRNILNFCISFSLAIPTAGLSQAASANTLDQPATKTADAYNLDFANLEKRGPGQVEDSLAPDRFLLMEQSVFRKEIPVVRTFIGHTFRKWRLQALQKKTAKYAIQLADNTRELEGQALIDFAKALLPMYASMKWIQNDHPIERGTLEAVAQVTAPGHLVDAILPLLALDEGQTESIQAIADPEARLDQTVTAMVTGLVRDHINNGRRVDTPLFIWESKADAARLNRIATVLETQEKQWETNRIFGAENETNAPYERKTRAINWWDTSVQIQDDDRVLQTLNLRDTVAGADTSQSQPFSCASKKCRFNLVKDGTVLHTFGVAASSVATLDQFVVFTNPEGYDEATGTQYLLFLDLKSYNGLIGNEDLPVFRLPLKIDEPVTEMSIRKGQLVLNNKYFVNSDYLQQASEMQQVVFNLQANLLSADSWAKVLPLVDSVQDYFSKSVRNEIETKVKEQAGLKEAGVLMKQLGTELQAHLEKQAKLKPFDKANEHSLAALDVASDSVHLYHKRVSESQVLGNVMGQSIDRMRISRKLTARVRLLGSALVSPRPFASQKIKEALGAWYIRNGDSGKTLMERMLRLTDRPFANAGVIAAGLMAAVAPESFHSMVNLGLSAGTSISDYITFALSGIGEASAAGTSATFAPFTDLTTLARQYVWDGAMAKTLVAIPTFIGFLAGLYFVGHFTFNLSQLFKDLKKPGIKGFIDRQQKFKEEYYARLAADEGHNRDLGASVEFTPEETEQIHQWTESRRAQIKEGGIFRRLGGAIKNTFDRVTTAVVSPLKSLIEASMESQTQDLMVAMDVAANSPAVQKGVNDSKEDHQAFWTAFRNTAVGEALGDASSTLIGGPIRFAGAAKDLAFSMPALELTLERWAKIWNEWAMFRFSTFGWAYVRVLGTDVPYMIKVKPISFVTKLIYPQFMKTVALRRTGQRVLPSELNGGMRPRGSSLAKLFSRSNGQNIDPQVAADATPFEPAEQLKALEKFEDQIIDVEAQISEVAFRKSLEALADFMTDKRDLNILFGAKGMTNIVQKDIRELSWKSQTFVRAHYESAYNAAMEAYLNGEIARREAQDIEGEEAPVVEINDEATPIPQAATDEVDVTQQDQQDSIATMKKKLIQLNLSSGSGVAQDYSFDVARAKADAIAEVGSEAHVEAANAAVKEGRLSVTNFLRNTKYSLIADYDPTQNPSMARVETVHRRLQSPGALGRAVRAEISKLLLSVPIELTARLIFTAGIFEGALKPLQDHFFEPTQNSLGYFSVTSMYMMFASGFVMSMMADAWLKVQQDARQDEAGEFGLIPKGEDAERGLLRWYFKQFNEKENSLMKNWGFSNRLAFWNMPAAVANIMLFWFMFSGRFDLSLLTAGYALSFATPISAFHYKVDQAFERAVHYAARGIKDEKWMAHPDVQKMLIPEMQKSRFRFTFANDLWSTIQGDWLGNVEMIPTSLGHRGFQRALFGGGLLEEYIINGALKPLGQAVSGIPVIGHVVNPLLKGCEFLLSNNNPDLTLKK